MTQPENPVPNPNQPDQSNPAPAPAPPKKKKRLWPKIVLGLVLVLILLVVFLPQIASTGLVRGIVVGQINKSLNGKLAIDNWSLGWTGGIDVNGIKVFDETGRQILDVPKFATQLTILNAVRGKYELGKTSIEGPITFALVVNPDGTTNFAKLTKMTPEEEAEKAKRAKTSSPLPNASGEFNAQAKGTIEQPGKPIVYVDSATLSAKVTDINQPVSNDAQLQLRVGDSGKPGTISLAGTVSAIQQNRVLENVGQIVSDEKLQITSIDLGTANAFVPATLKAAIAGVVNGAIAIQSDGKNSAGVNGNVTVDDAKVSGELLKGDTLHTAKINVPINIAADVTDVNNTRVNISTLRVEMPDIDVLVDVKGQLMQQALANISAHKPPGSAGTLSATVSAANFKKLSEQLPNLLPLEKGAQIDGGKFTQTINLTVNPQNSLAAMKIDLSDVRGMRDGKQVAIEPVSLSANATLNPGDPMKSLADIGVELKSVFAQLKGGGPSVAKIDLNGSFDLARLREQLSQLFDLGQAKLDGQGTIAITSEGKVAANSTIMTTAKFGISNLNVSLPNRPPVNLNDVLLDSKWQLPLDANSSVSGLKSNNLSFTSSVASASLKNIDVELAPKSVWAKLKSADAQIDVPKMSSAYDLASAFSAPTTQPATLPPLQITEGSARIVVNVARDSSSNLTKLNVAQCDVNALGLKRGEKTFAFNPKKPIALKLAADIDAGDEIKSLKLTQLSGDLRVAELSMPEPIVVNDPTGKMTAAGAIAMTGDIGAMTQLLAVVQGGNELPYAGDFAVSQKLSTDASKVITLNGDITAKNFQVFETDKDGKKLSKPSFTEKELAIRNDVSVDQEKSLANIRALTVDMPQSKAASVKLTGAVNDYSNARQLENIKLEVAYDLPKLWPIVHPMMLTPGKEDPYKDLKIEGSYQKTFLIKGSYPATAKGKPLAWNESIRTVEASGDLSVQKLDTSGIMIEKLELPIWLRDGVAVLKYAGKPKAEQVAKPATINGGTLDLGGISLDLTGPEMRASMGKNQKLVQRMTINPLLGDTLGKYVNPIFANSKRAAGLLEVTVNECDRVALGEKMKSPQSGKAVITINLTDMDIANPLGSLMLGPILNLVGGKASDVDTFRGQIKNAIVTLDAGRTTQDLTMQLVAPGSTKEKPQTMPLTFSGNIDLATLQQRLAVNIPTGLISTGGDWSKAFPSGIPITLVGTTTSPKPDLGDIAGKLAQSQIQSQLQRALGGGKDSKDKENNVPSVDQLIRDALGQSKDDNEQPKDQPKPKKKNPQK